MGPLEALLRKAKHLIETVGWYQGALAHRDTKDQIVGYCAMGAICYANGKTDYDLIRSAKNLLRKGAGLDPDTLLGVDWNDDGSRTKEEVLKAFDAAIALAMKDGL